MKLFGFAILGLATLAGSKNQVDNQTIQNSFISSGNDAYYIAPSKIVLDSEVAHITFTPEGRYAIIAGIQVQKLDPETSMRLTLGLAIDNSKQLLIWKLWDTEKGWIRDIPANIVDLIKPQQEDASYLSFDWTSQPALAILQRATQEGSTAKEIETEILRVDFITGQIKSFGKLPGLYDWQVMSSPKAPIIILLHETRNKPLVPIDVKTTIEFTVYDLNLNVLKRGADTFKGIVDFGEWTVDGRNLVGSLSVRHAIGATPTRTVLVLNTQTGQISPTTEKIPLLLDQNAEPALELSTGIAPAAFGNAKNLIDVLWLSAKKSPNERPLMIATEVEDNYWLSPRLDRIAYVSKNRLFSRDIAKIDLATFNKAMDEVSKREAIFRAKQVGLAILLYSTDSDDYLPLKAGFDEGVYPYLKNRDLLNGFVYLMDGQNVSKIDDPVKTEVGYISTKTGRIVVYVDGHVKFKINP